MIGVSFFALVLSLLAPAWPAPERASDPPFSLAVLRRDGHVIPFAAYDRGFWTAPWPIDTRDAELPISLDTVPETWWGRAGRPAAMAIWTNGVNRGVLRPERPTMRTTTCGSRLALATNYRSDNPVIPPPAEQPYPKDGLAVWGGQRIDPIEILTPTDSLLIYDRPRPHGHRPAG